jgi:type II secretory pathway predicted ATPase ExeA
MVLNSKIRSIETGEEKMSVYLNYWGLKEEPFGNAPNSQVFFLSPQHEEAVIRMSYAVEHRKGVAMLTGHVGSGKTTVARAMAKRLPSDRFEIHMIHNPALNPDELIKAIFIKFNEKANGYSKTELLDQIQNRLVKNARQGKNTVLIIDEVHVIDNPSTFEELRMLLNIQSEDQFLITLILLGQPPLLEKISALQPLQERIAIKYDLEPLNYANTERYIMFRLKAAGANRGIFTKESIGPLYEYSRGIPLRINNVCDRSLLMGVMKKARLIDSQIVRQAIEDLK